MQHHFDIDIAKEFGVNTAIFLDNIAYWTLKNIANKTHYYDNLYWTYNTIQAFTQLFPYWSIRQLRVIIDYCVDKNLLIEGNFNQHKYDKTKWYALTKKGLLLFNLQAEIDFSHVHSHLSELTNESAPDQDRPTAQEKNKELSVQKQDENPIYVCPDSFVNSDKSGPDSFVRIDKPIPDRKQLPNPLYNARETFDCFFSLYPIKKSENRAFAIWESQECYLIAESILLKLQEQIEHDSCFLDGFAPNPDNYLLRERWKDEIQIRNKEKKTNASGLTDDLSWG